MCSPLFYGLSSACALCAAINELRRGTPGVMRKRIKPSYRVDPDDRLARCQHSVRDRAQRSGSMGTL